MLHIVYMVPEKLALDYLYLFGVCKTGGLNVHWPGELAPVQSKYSPAWRP